MDQTLAQIILVVIVLAAAIAWARRRNASAPADIDFAWTPTPGPSPTVPPPQYAPQPSSGLHVLLKWAIAIWAIGYAVLSCSPMLISGTDTGTSVAAGGIASLIVGATLFGPWIVGLLVLGVLVWVTK